MEHKRARWQNESDADKRESDIERDRQQVERDAHAEAVRTQADAEARQPSAQARRAQPSRRRRACSDSTRRSRFPAGASAPARPRPGTDDQGFVTETQNSEKSPVDGDLRLSVSRRTGATSPLWGNGMVR